MYKNPDLDIQLTLKSTINIDISRCSFLTADCLVFIPFMTWNRKSWRLIIGCHIGLEFVTKTCQGFWRLLTYRPWTPMFCQRTPYSLWKKNSPKCQEVHSRLNPVKSCAYILSLNVVVPIIIYPKETHNLHQKVSVQYSFFEVVVCSGYKISWQQYQL